jgi:large subunit ribosomal protein L15
MNLTDVPGDPGRKQKRRRVGRGEGSGHGKTCGRGHKGAQSRSGTAKGGGFEGGQMPFYRRVPKRGFSNRSRVEYAVVNVERLNAFEDGAEVTVQRLFEERMIRPRTASVKILGVGELTKKLTVRAHAFSKSAREKIAAAGGTAEAI